MNDEKKERSQLLDELRATRSRVATLEAELAARAAVGSADRAPFGRLARHSPIAIWHADPDGFVLDVNARWCELSGYTRQEALGEGWIRAVHPADRDRVVAAWEEVLADPAEHFDIELRYQRPPPDGGVVWVVAQSAREVSERGEVLGYIGTVTEMTAHREAQEQLERSKARLIEAQEIARLGSWEWGPAADEMWWSDELFRIFGYEEERVRPSFAAAFEQIHPEDRERYKSWIDETFRERPSQPIEYRSYCHDGSLRTILATARVERDGDGHPVRLCGIAQDVTERKQFEQALHDSVERFRHALVESPIPLMLHAESGEIIELSRSWAEQSGYPRHRLTRVTDWTRLAFGRTMDLAQERIDKSFQLDERRCEGVFRVVTATGARRYWEFHSSPAGRLEDGCKLVLTAATDVSARHSQQQ